MRKLLSALFLCALLLSVVSAAKASGEPSKNKVVVPKAVISLTYWDGRLQKVYPTRTENSTQGFFPVIIGNLKIKGRFSATGEYGWSRFSDVTGPGMTNKKEKAARAVFGLRYDIRPGVYVNVSRPDMKLVAETPTTRVSARISGIQYGIGMGMPIKGTHSIVGVEFNMSPDMMVSYRTMGITAKSTGPAMDIKSVVYFKLKEAPKATVYLGYRYMKLESQAAPPICPVPVDYKLTGPLAGVKYVF